MKKIFNTLLLLLLLLVINAQALNRDSLRSIISKNRADTNMLNALVHLSNQLTPSGSADVYALEALSLAEKLDYKKGKADCYLILGDQASYTINFGKAIQYGLSALSLYQDLRDPVGMASAHGLLQAVYRTAGDYRNSLTHAFSCLQIAETYHVMGDLFIRGHSLTTAMLAEIAQNYILMNQLDSAIYFTKKAIQVRERFNGAEWNFPVYLLATIQNVLGNYLPALENYRKALPLAIRNGFFHDTLQIFSGMSTLFKKTKQPDSAIHYAKMVVASSNPELEIKNLLEAVANLADVYKMYGNKDSALKYIEESYRLKDSLFSNEKDREIQNVAFRESVKQQELIANHLKYKSRIQLYILAGGITILILIVGILLRTNKQKQKSKDDIERAYGELKAAQTQLIQSEKMASLGELTAGIAHEIQNPLNFVNNFSEVNKELVEEMQQEMDKGNYEDAKVISNDIAANEEKIIHHGKRADAIVKGMLQHSRPSSSQKEPTDINKLVDEYLRLSYHGLRAKDKTFNATLQTDFDKDLSSVEGKINIIPQDIGRVLLNLYNNAFYAVNEKKKTASGDYEPIVEVSTKKLNGKVEIRVKDNGNGIPQNVLDKIFQPFFTTKPTGQGTGLGLSLAYDIVKAHGGELAVETKEGIGAVFIILLSV